jgi:hypothetical protein
MTPCLAYLQPEPVLMRWPDVPALPVEEGLRKHLGFPLQQGRGQVDRIGGSPGPATAPCPVLLPQSVGDCCQVLAWLVLHCEPGPGREEAGGRRACLDTLKMAARVKGSL